MQIINIGQQTATLILTEQEVILLSNCLNEAQELGEEFDIRVGSSSGDARSLMAQLHEILKLMNEDQ